MDDYILYTLPIEPSNEELEPIQPQGRNAANLTTLKVPGSSVPQPGKGNDSIETIQKICDSIALVSVVDSIIMLLS